MHACIDTVRTSMQPTDSFNTAKCFSLSKNSGKQILNFQIPVLSVVMSFCIELMAI